MTVFENMAFALTVRKLKKDEIEARVVNTAKILKIDHLLHRKPKELSGGQRQRVAIGRAIVRNPFAFLFDEPLSNLDSALRCQMRYELAKLKAQLNTTMVYVTHDQAEAMTLADKIVVMRDGIIEQEGSPLELYASPVNMFVAKFIGSSEMNIIEVSYVRDSGKLSLFRLQTGEEVSLPKYDGIDFSEESAYFLGIRPEDIELPAQNNLFFGNKMEGIVFLAENLGGDGYLHVTIQDGTQISIKTQKTTKYNVGDKVTLCYRIEKCYLFDENKKTLIGQSGIVTPKKEED
jgi:ABC-type sugar transport system ATPase subunit